MSEPVGYFEQEYVGGPVLFYQVNYRAEGSIPLYLHPDPRVAELEAVLRECREALVKNIVGTGGRTPAAHEAIAKIDEVLNVPDNSRTA